MQAALRKEKKQKAATNKASIGRESGKQTSADARSARAGEIARDGHIETARAQSSREMREGEKKEGKNC